MTGRGIGWVVVVLDHGKWCDDWDGLVHQTRVEAETSYRDAVEAGWTAKLCLLVPELVYV